MIVDSSAMIAASERAAIAAPTVLETAIARSRFGPALLDALDRFVAEAPLAIVPVGKEHLAAAQDAFKRFGRASGHPARLNYGDCISYATAVVAGEPVLFKGYEFIHTDVVAARRPASNLGHDAARGGRKTKSAAPSVGQKQRQPRA